MKEINEAIMIAKATTTSCINSLHTIKMNTTLDITTQKETIIQDLSDLRDSVLTDVAVFQNNLNKNTSAKIVDEMKLLQSKLKSDMGTYVLDHSLKMQSNIADLKEEMKIELLVEMKHEQTRIKIELIAELRTSHVHTNLTHAGTQSSTAIPPQGENNATMHGCNTMQDYVTTQNDAYEEYESTHGPPSPDTPNTNVYKPPFNTNGPSNTTMAPEHPHSPPAQQAPAQSRDPSNFLGVHPIYLTGGKNHILTQHQFQYPIRLGQFVTEVESHRFQKAHLHLKCTGPDGVFTFYNAFRHIAANFKILLRPLTEITR